ncbi:YdeI/OmpD-associated family protein [Compostibacter hankyongensis]|uniref:DUF1905 domain-containing protein n=1 Tax=Compostibacter hankyongensis TaxID=1007089 RepID=A0ABP8FBH8_9BACT
MKIKTTILQTGNNTGIPVPEALLDKLGAGKKPLVKVTLNGYTYRSAVGKMNDQYMISLSAANRKNAGVQGGEKVEVDIELDTAPRTVELPDDLSAALKKNKQALEAFEKLAPSKKKAMVLSVMEAKTPETRQRRIDKALSVLGS